MKVLFTVHPSVGHLHPLVPVANALSDAGHEVAICSAPSFRPEVEAFGLSHIDAIAAERLGIPHASIAGNAYAAIDSPEVDYFPGNRRMLAGPLARHRLEFGLPPDLELRMSFRHLHLCFTPPDWDGTSAPRPDNTRFLRHTNTLPPGASLPDWVARLPDRPTVLASLGTVFNKTPGVLQAILDALREEPVNLVVAIGRDQDPGSFGPQPDHVRLEPYVPQALLLAHCDAFVTHGGASTASRRRSAPASRWSSSRSAPTSPTAPSAQPTSASPERSEATTVPPTPSEPHSETCSPSRATGPARERSRRRCWRCPARSKGSTCSRSWCEGRA